MTRVILCDKCKTIIMNYSESHTIKVCHTRGEKDLYFHLCENCFNDFKKFMNVEIEESND